MTSKKLEDRTLELLTDIVLEHGPTVINGLVNVGMHKFNKFIEKETSETVSQQLTKKIVKQAKTNPQNLNIQEIVNKTLPNLNPEESKKLVANLRQVLEKEVPYVATQLKQQKIDQLEKTVQKQQTLLNKQQKSNIFL